jgi:hypothetical protein
MFAEPLARVRIRPASSGQRDPMPNKVHAVCQTAESRLTAFTILSTVNGMA